MRRAEDEEEGDFFYDEDEVLAGADGETRAAMLDHYDSLLTMPRADELDEVLPHHAAWPCPPTGRGSACPCQASQLLIPDSSQHGSFEWGEGASVIV